MKGNGGYARPAVVGFALCVAAVVSGVCVSELTAQASGKEPDPYLRCSTTERPS